LSDLKVVIRQGPQKLGLRARSQENPIRVSDLRGTRRARLQILPKKLGLASFTPPPLM